MASPNRKARMGRESRSRSAQDIIDEAEWRLGLDEFFDRLFMDHDEGKISLDQIGEFFPEDVKERARKRAEEDF